MIRFLLRYWDLACFIRYDLSYRMTCMITSDVRRRDDAARRFVDFLSRLILKGRQMGPSLGLWLYVQFTWMLYYAAGKWISLARGEFKHGRRTERVGTSEGWR